MVRNTIQYDIVSCPNIRSPDPKGSCELLPSLGARRRRPSSSSSVVRRRRPSSVVVVRRRRPSSVVVVRRRSSVIRRNKLFQKSSPLKVLEQWKLGLNHH